MTLIVDARIVGPWVCSRTDAVWRPDTTAMGWFDGRDIIAGTVFRDWNGTSLFADMAVAQGRTLPRAYLRLMGFYVWGQLSAKALLTSTFGSNTRSLALQEKMRAKRLALLPGVGRGGEDVIINALYPDNPIWQRMRDGRRRLDASTTGL